MRRASLYIYIYIYIYIHIYVYVYIYIYIDCIGVTEGREAWASEVAVFFCYVLLNSQYCYIMISLTNSLLYLLFVIMF